MTVLSLLAAAGPVLAPPAGAATSDDPLGSLDQVYTSPTGTVVRGWAFDPGTAEPVAVHGHVDGRPARALTADADRPDVAAAFAGQGRRHGFSTVPPRSLGTHRVCVYAETGPTGCRTLVVPR